MAAVGFIPTRAPESAGDTLRSMAQAHAMAVESQLIGDAMRVEQPDPVCFVVEVGLLLRQAIERVLHRQEEVFPLPVWLLVPDDDLLRKVAPVSTPSPVPADYRAVQAIRRYPALAAHLEPLRTGRALQPFTFTVMGPMSDAGWHAFAADGAYLCQIDPTLDL